MYFGMNVETLARACFIRLIADAADKEPFTTDSRKRWFGKAPAAAPPRAPGLRRPTRTRRELHEMDDSRSVLRILLCLFCPSARKCRHERTDSHFGGFTPRTRVRA